MATPIPARVGAPSTALELQASRRKSGASTTGRKVCTAVDTGTTVAAGLRWNADMLVRVAAIPMPSP